jgi:hypothetical protein
MEENNGGRTGFMNKLNLSSVIQLMRGAIDRMQKDGALKSREGRIVRLQDVFPFRPEDVESVSYTEINEGGGLRFRLHSGRIFDGLGQSRDAP